MMFDGMFAMPLNGPSENGVYGSMYIYSFDFIYVCRYVGMYGIYPGGSCRCN